MKKLVYLCMLSMLYGCSSAVVTGTSHLSGSASAEPVQSGTKPSQKMRCNNTPPIRDTSKLIDMLIKSGDILKTDTDSVKHEKLARYISLKLKGSSRCNK